jgi:hypothetical protein
MCRALQSRRTAAWDRGFRILRPINWKAFNGHQLPEGHRIVATPILGGLHHEHTLRLTGGIDP